LLRPNLSPDERIEMYNQGDSSSEKFTTNGDTKSYALYQQDIRKKVDTLKNFTSGGNYEVKEMNAKDLLTKINEIGYDGFSFVDENKVKMPNGEVVETDEDDGMFKVIDYLESNIKNNFNKETHRKEPKTRPKRY
jgi:hypothetical protein